MIDFKLVMGFLPRVGFERNIIGEPAGEFYAQDSGIVLEGWSSRLTIGEHDLNLVFKDGPKGNDMVNIRLTSLDGETSDILARAHDCLGTPLEFRSLILSSLDILRRRVAFFAVVDSYFWYRINYSRPRLKIGDHPWGKDLPSIKELGHSQDICTLSNGEDFHLGDIHAATLARGSRYLDWRFTEQRFDPPILKGILNQEALSRRIKLSGPYRDVDYRPFVFESERLIRGSSVVI